MKKNILQKQVAGEVVERIRKIQPSVKPLWGSMTAVEMFYHVNEVLRRTMSTKVAPKKTTLKHKVLKTYFIYMAPRFPKNVEAPKLVNMKKNNFQLEGFEQEQNKLIARIREFQQCENEFAPDHPIFGRLTKKQWGIFSWMHVDHHLRQFGV
jgi:hypothetical protein